MTALDHCLQRLNAARGTPVAIFVIDGKVLCTSPNARRHKVALKDWPGSLMGHYTSAVDMRWLAEDLEFMGARA